MLPFGTLTRVIDAIAGWPRRRLLALVTLARRHGVDEAALLEGTGLTVVDLADPHHELTHGHEYAAIRNLLARTDPASPLALEAGLDFHLSTVPAWGEAMRTSRTLGEAIAFSMRYSQAIPSTVAFSAEFEGDQIHLTYAADDVPADVAEFVVLRTMVSTSMTSRELLGRRVPLTSVASAFPKPPFASAFEDFYGVGVDWDAPATGVTIAARWLQAPLPGADDEAHRRAADQCRLILQRHSSPAGLAARARAHLAVHHSLAVTLPQLADALGVSERSLRRHLATAGTSFRALLAESRLLAAGDLLRAGMSVEEASARMGYSEPSAFSHAFKRWSGRSPESWRRAPATD
jgi:AraC-like DNA-binding protein